jgi:Tfp pilus assembly protein PilO
MLHQVKKGVWEHLINLTLEIIKQMPNSRTANQVIFELDLCIRLVPRYPGLKKFSKGISHLSQITAAEYQQLMRVCFNFWSIIVFTNIQ